MLKIWGDTPRGYTLITLDALSEFHVKLASVNHGIGCNSENFWGAENASTGKRKYGKGKYETAHFARVENACMENASTNLQGWKTQVRKMQVQCKPSVR